MGSRDERFAHRSGWVRYRNPARSSGAPVIIRTMPDPFLLIVGIIAIACVLLFPIRLWRRRSHRYGDGEDE